MVSSRHERRGLLERLLIGLHRWVGIGLAVLMTLWAASGVVMLYVAFPDLSDAEHYAGLAALQLDRCCAESAGAQLAGAEQIEISMLGERPVARSGNGPARATLDLVSGEWLGSVSADLAEATAAAHLQLRGVATRAAGVTRIHNDQWTVYQRFHAHRPLYKVAFDSPHGDTIYVSGRTAEVVQDTRRNERFWNWLGAVPHWLYYTAIREHQAAWYRFIVYSSVLGVLLCLSGLYLGINRTLAARGRWSSFVGALRWHHVTGLVFGVLTLTWVFSGLVSMNPWGWLESHGEADELGRLHGGGLTANRIDDVLLAARGKLDAGVVSLEISAAAETIRVVAVNTTNVRQRLDPTTLSPTPVEVANLLKTLATMRPDADTRSLQLLDEEDAYYFGHKGEVDLPVYRAILNDAGATRYYFHASSGEQLARVDRNGRLYRWLHYGLHRLDFGSLLRSRPVWDLVILPLLAGVTLLCGIGCWVGYRHLRYRRRARKRIQQPVPG